MLEERVLPSVSGGGSTLTVTTTADSGAGSLRQAILDANNNTSGSTTIDFDITGGAGYNANTGVATIQPLSALPTITAPVIIDATSQPGYAGTPLIVLSGLNAGGNASGLVISGGSSTVEGLVINQFGGDGIDLTTNGGDVIEGDYIGTDVTGTSALGNGGSGLVVSSAGNTIGGTTAAARNVISGNVGDGVNITGSSATGNLVEGNYIGTDVTGTTRLGNGNDGVLIANGAQNNTIGGATATFCNVISGNNGRGVEINGSSSNIVQSNYIGVNAAGTGALGNGGDGVSIIDANNNQIGGAGTGNVISGNSRVGIWSYGSNNNTIAGNYIGTNATGNAAIGNGIWGVILQGGSSNNQIGVVGGGNVISGNNPGGVLISGVGTTGNVVEGNYIGTNAAGTAALGNANDGVYIGSGAQNNTIGGTTVAARNIISGNLNNGVEIYGAGTTGNLVEGNYIGTDVTGMGSPGFTRGVSGAVSGDSAVALNGSTGYINLPSGAFNYPTSGSTNDYNLTFETWFNAPVGSKGGVILGQTGSGADPGSNGPGSYVPAVMLGTDGKIHSSLFWHGTGSFITSAATYNDGNWHHIAVTYSNGTETLYIDGAAVGSNSGVEYSYSSAYNYFLGTGYSGGWAGGNGGWFFFDGRLDETATYATALSSSQVAAHYNAASSGFTTYSAAVLADSPAAYYHLDDTSGVALDSSGNSLNAAYSTAPTSPIGNQQNGILISAGANNNTIGGPSAIDPTTGKISGAGNVISGNRGSGVAITDSGTNNNVVAGNFIGTDATGTATLFNASGVFIASANNTIGGTTSAERNIISGNVNNGVDINGSGATGNTVEGNYIGTDVTGTVSLAVGSRTPWSAGVLIHGGAQDNIIGTNGDGVNDAAEGNLISGNIGDGVGIFDNGTNNNIVAGNLIGTDYTGKSAVTNGWAGILITFGAQYNRIGANGADADAAAERNVISGNSYGNGVEIGRTGTNYNWVAGNYIGTDITGTAALANAGGVWIWAASNLIGTNGDGVGDAAERNVISGNTGGGIVLNDNNNVVAGNYIGTDYTGKAALGNGWVGIQIAGGASNNRIGGDGSSAAADAAERNIISGNGWDGVQINGAGTINNIVAGNYIGTDLTGTVAVPNNLSASGIAIFNGASNNRIGTSGAEADNAGERNLVSGNGIGIYISDPTTTDNLVAGNYIGVNAAGTAALGNNTGVFVQGPNNTIGGTTAAMGNVIAGNSNYGIQIAPTSGTSSVTEGDNEVVEGNYIGTNADGTAALSNGTGILVQGSNNTIGGNVTGAGNVISGNSGSGVSIAPVVPTISSETLADQLNAGQLPRQVATGTIDQADLSDQTAPSNGDWSYNNPLPGGGGTNYAFLATGTLQVNTAGTYTFALGSDDGSRLRIDGQDVVDEPYPEAFADHFGSVTLTAGTHTIEWMGYQAYGLAGFELSVAVGGGKTGPVTTANGWHVLGDPNPDPAIALQGSLNVTVSYALPTGGQSNVVAGNYIGTTADGTAALSNGTGISITSADNTIGGTTAAARNIISGNSGLGVYITGTSATGNAVEGNYIGTNAAGDAAVGNGTQGVYISGGAENNVIGTNGDGVEDANEGNVISASRYVGVYITGAGTTGNVVAGNLIGTDATGTAALGNGGVGGVRITGGASQNRIGTNGDGTSDTLERNVISGNTNGVQIDGAGTDQNIVAGNYIGTDRSGTAALGNATFGVVVSAGAQSNVIGTNGDGVNDAAEGNVISGNGFWGVYIGGLGTNYNVLAGNYIGTDYTGMQSVPNGTPPATGGGGGGAVIDNLAEYNRIGTDGNGVSDDLERNVISGNSGWDGLMIQNANNNAVAGNYIGVAADGLTALGNGTGIDIKAGSQGNLIGVNPADTDSTAERNIISGNRYNGIIIWNNWQTGTANNVVAGNYIGTDKTGATALGNGGNGIFIFDGVQNNIIGGTASGTSNVIAGNVQNGIFISDSGTTGNVVEGNYIGTNAAGAAGLGNGGDGVLLNSTNNYILNNTYLSNGNYALELSAGAQAYVTGTVDGSVNDYGTIDMYGAALTIGTLTGTGVVTNSGALATFTVNGGGSFGGDITGANTALTVDGGSRILVLWGNNSYAGKTTINSTDTLQAGSSTALSASSNLSDNGTLDLAGFNNSVGALNGNGTVTNSSSTIAALTVTGGGSFSGNIAGANTALTVGGSNQTLILSGNNSYGGTTTINSTDTLQAGSSTALSVNSTVTDDGTLDLVGFDNSAAALNGTGAIINSIVETIATLSVGSGTFSGVIGGSPGTVIISSESMDYQVLNTNDSGAGSLRQAILNADQTAPSSSITFAIPGSGTQTIQPLSALPQITAPVVLDGTSQPGYNGTPLIVLSGLNAGSNADGLVISGGNSTVEGLAINQFSGNGITISSANNTIGGTSAGQANVISYNTGDGVNVSGSLAVGNSIRGNSIYGNGGLGIDLAGTGNNDQASPAMIAAALDSATPVNLLPAGTTQFKATFTGQANTTYHLDVYDNYATGQTYLGTVTIITDSNGNPVTDGDGNLLLDGSGNPVPAASASSTFFFVLNTTPQEGDVLSVTATDPEGNTSQFSNDITTILRPEVSMAGLDLGVRGQVIPYTLTPSATASDLAAGLNYSIDWGDGAYPNGVNYAQVNGGYVDRNPDVQTINSTQSSVTQNHVFTTDQPPNTPYTIAATVQDQYGFTGVTVTTTTQINLFALENNNSEIDVGAHFGGSTFQLTGVLSHSAPSTDTFNLDLDGGTNNGGLTINYADAEFTPAVLASLTKFVLWGQLATGTQSNYFDASNFTGSVDLHNGPGNNTLVGSSSGTNVFNADVHANDNLLIVAPSTADNTLSFTGADQAVSFDLGQLSGQAQQVTATGDTLTVTGSVPVNGQPTTAGSISTYYTSNFNDTLSTPGANNLKVFGGAGNDTYVINPDPGSDPVYSVSNSTFTGGSGNSTFTIAGGTGNNSFTINNSSFTGSNNSTFTVNGGSGNTTFTLSNSTTSNSSFTIATAGSNSSFTIGSGTSSGTTNSSFTLVNTTGSGTFTLGNVAAANGSFTINSSGTNGTFTMGNVVASNGTFTVAGGSSNSSFTLGNVVTNSTFTVSTGTGNSTFTLGNVVNNGTFTVGAGVGNGSFTLGSVTNNGTFTVTSGTTTNSSFTLGTIASNNGTFTVGSSGIGNSSFTLGSITTSGNSSFTLGSIGSGNSTFTLNGVTSTSSNSSFTLTSATGNNSFTMNGNMTVSNSSFTLGTTGTGNSTFTMNGNVTSSNSSFTLLNNASGNSSFTLGNTTAIGNGTFTVVSSSGNGSFTLDNTTLSGNGTFTVSTAGTGNGTFTLGNTITSGNGTFTVSTADASNGTFTLANTTTGNGTFTVVSTGSGNGTFTLGNTTVTGNGTFTVGSSASGNSSFTLGTTAAGNGTFTVGTSGTGNSTFILGTTTAGNGTFTLTNGGGNGTFTVGTTTAGNGTFTVASSAGNGTFTLGNTAVSGNGTFTVSTSGTGNGTFTLANTTAGNGTFTVVSTGSGNGTFTLGNTSVTGNGTFTVGSSASGNSSFTLGTTTAGNGTFIIGTSGTGNSTFQLGTTTAGNGTFTLTASSGNGTFTLGNTAVTGNGTFTVSTSGTGNGTFTLANSTIGGNGTFTVSASDSSNGTFTLGDITTGSNGTFTVVNTGSGNGTFTLGNTSVTGNGTFTVGTSGLGNGTFTLGNTAVSGNGSFTMGTSGIGNATFTLGGITTAGNGTFIMSAAGGNATFTVTNGITGSGNNTFVVNDLGAPSGTTAITVNSNLTGGAAGNQFFVQALGAAAGNESITINGNLIGGAGDDRLNISTANPGNDTIAINGGFYGDPTGLQGGGNDLVLINNGGSGNNSISLTGGIEDAGNGNTGLVLSNTGDGNNTFTVGTGFTGGSGQGYFLINNLGNGNNQYAINGPVSLGNTDFTFVTMSQAGNGNNQIAVNGPITVGNGNDFFSFGEAGTGTDSISVAGPVTFGTGDVSFELSGGGMGNKTFNFKGGVQGSGFDTYTINDHGALSGDASFTVNGNFGGGPGNNTFIVTSGLGGSTGTDTFTFNGNLEGGSAFNTFSITNAGAAYNPFTFNGSLVGGTNDTGDNFDLAGNYLGTLGLVSGSGTGTDNFQFAGALQGNFAITTPYQANRTDTLDFSTLSQGINVDISSTSAQQVAPGLSLQLSDANGISNVIGSSHDNIIHGNGRSNLLAGYDALDSNYTPNAPGIGSNGKKQVVLLDFDTGPNNFTATINGQQVPVFDFSTYYAQYGVTPIRLYTQAERQAVLQGLEAAYAPWVTAGVLYFTLDPADAQAKANLWSDGHYITEYFDQTPGANTTPDVNGPPPPGVNQNLQPGGTSDNLDFRDVDMSGTASIQINGILGEPLHPPPTEQNWVGLSVDLAAHELGHLLGLHHDDAFGPIGQGIIPLPNGMNYGPTYTGPYDAAETFNHIITSGDATGTDWWNAVRGLFFGEREDIMLAFAFAAPTTPGPQGSLLVQQDTSAVNASTSSDSQPVTTQSITLAPLTVPNTQLYGRDAGKTFEVQAVDVMGNIGLDSTGHSQKQYYSFTGNAGDVINANVMSYGITRYVNQGAAGYFDSVAYLYYKNPDGTLTQVAFNDDTFSASASGDSTLKDIVLSKTGTYVLEVRPFFYAPGEAHPDPSQFTGDNLIHLEDAINNTYTGNYELFVYRFKAGMTTSGNNTFIAGTGDATMIGGQGANTFYLNSAANDTVVGVGSNNTVIGGSSTNNWDLTGYDTGMVNNASFTNVQNLVGGSGINNFTLQPGSSLAGSITGGSGGVNTIIVSRDANFTLTDTSLTTSDGDAYTLANIQQANLTTGPDAHTFDVSGWSGGGQLTGGGNAILTVTKNADFTLTSSSLASSDGMNVSYAGLATLNITGSGAANTVNVQSTNAAVTTTVTDQGTINVGSLMPAAGGILDNIAGALIVNGGGTATLVADDTGSSKSKTGTLTPTTLTGLGMGASGISYSGLKGLNISLGSGDDTFNINDINSNTATTVDGGAGIDTANVSFAAAFAGNLSLPDFEKVFFTIAGDVSGKLVVPTIITQLTIDGSVTASGSITAGTITTLNVGKDMAGQIDVTGTLGSLTVGGSASGSIVAGSIGSVAVAAATGSPLLNITQAGVQRELVAALAGNGGVLPDSVVFTLFYDGQPAGGPQLSVRVNNPDPVANCFDLSLLTFSDTAKFNLAHLDAIGTSGIRNVAIEGDLLSTVTQPALAYFGLPATTAGGIALPTDNLVGVAVRDQAAPHTIQAASIQGVAFSATTEENGKIKLATDAKSEDAADLLVKGTAIVQANDTFRVPFADALPVALFIARKPTEGTDDGHHDDDGHDNKDKFDEDSRILFTDQVAGDPRGAVTAVVSVGVPLNSNGKPDESVIQTINLLGNGGSISTNVPITTAITSTGQLGDLDVRGVKGVFTANVTAPSIIGNIHVRDGAIAGTIQTTAGDFGRLLTDAKGNIIGTTVVDAEQGITGQIISYGNLISIIKAEGQTSGMIAAGGDIGAILRNSDGTAKLDAKGRLVRFGGLDIDGMFSGQVVALGNIFGDLELNDFLGRIAVHGQAIAGLDPARMGILGNVEIKGQFAKTAAIVSGGMIGDAGSRTDLDAGDVKGILAAKGTINLDDGKKTKHAAFYGANLGQTPGNVNAAAIDAIFSENGGALDISELDLIIKDLLALTVDANGNLTGPTS